MALSLRLLEFPQSKKLEERRGTACFLSPASSQGALQAPPTPRGSHDTPSTARVRLLTPRFPSAAGRAHSSLRATPDGEGEGT